MPEFHNKKRQGGNQYINRTESKSHNYSFEENDFAEVKAIKIDEIANIKGKEFATLTDNKGRKLIKTNQIRNFFSHFNTIRNEFKKLKIINQSIEELDSSLILIKPKLAYAKGRNKGLEPFQQLMFEVIDKVYKSSDKDKAYTNFFEFVEAIVAYHKYYGGEDN